MKDLSIRLETIKILEENIGSKILDTACSNIFFSDISPQSRETKFLKNGIISNYIIFCTAKETINKMKRQPTEWENIATDTSDKGLKSKIYKVLTKLNTKKQLAKLKNGQRT